MPMYWTIIGPFSPGRRCPAENTDEALPTCTFNRSPALLPNMLDTNLADSLPLRHDSALWASF